VPSATANAISAPRLGKEKPMAKLDEIGGKGPDFIEVPSLPRLMRAITSGQVFDLFPRESRVAP
jgi:hypothetical protein